MTRLLLSWVVSLRVSFSVRIILLGLALALVPLTLTVDVVRLALGTARERRLLRAETVKCPAGHEVTLTGGWRCSCGVTFEGNGFAACPACGERSWVQCPCGRAVRNRLAGRRS